MKVHIEIDLTPEEARTLAGLPNYDQMHKMFLDNVKSKFEQSANGMEIEPMVKAWADLGTSAQDTFNSFLKAAISGSKSFDFSTDTEEKK